MTNVEELEVLAEYPGTGRVVKLADGTIRAEGVFDEAAAPMVGRASFVTHPDPPPRKVVNEGMADRCLLSNRQIQYVERMPWERPAAKPTSEGSLRLHAEAEARQKAYDDWEPDKRTAEPDPGPSDDELRAIVLRKARENAEQAAQWWLDGRR